MTETIQVSPGNQIPAIPRHLVKVGVDYAVTDVWKVGGNALFVSSQYFSRRRVQPVRQAAVLHRVQSPHLLSGRRRTSSSTAASTTSSTSATQPTAQFFDREALPNFTNGGADFTDPRSLSPARPRAFYAGMRVTF